VVQHRQGYRQKVPTDRHGSGKRYLASWRTADGKEHKQSFDRKTDATRFLVEVEDSKLRGSYVDPSAGRLDLRTQADRWYKTTAALKPTTRRDYRSLLDNHVLPRFGDWPLTGIDTLAVKEWVAAMVSGGLGGKRAGKALQVLAGAVQRGRGRPARTQRGGRGEAAEIPAPRVLFLEAAQVEALAAAMDERWRVLVLLSAYTGLRPCELVALKVSRLDLLRGTLRVAEAAPEVAGHPRVGQREDPRGAQGASAEVPARRAGRPPGGCDPRAGFAGVHRGAGRADPGIQVGAGLLQAGGARGGPAGGVALVRPAPHGG
jgi:hypothetical protein